LCNLPPTLQNIVVIVVVIVVVVVAAAAAAAAVVVIQPRYLNYKKTLITGWKTKVRFQIYADFLVLSTRSALGKCEIAGFSSSENETSPILECHTALIPINAV
jgi:hypothetical protein